MPRAVLFGYDGVLVDQSGLREEILLKVLAEEGISPSAESLAANRPEAPYERWLEGFLEGYEAVAELALAARLMARASAAYRGYLRETGPRTLPGATRLLELVAAGGLPAALVAEAPSDEVERAVRAAGLETAFRFVVTEADLVEPANRLSGWQLALGLLNSQPPLPERLIHPHEVAAVAGGESGLRAAAEAGLVTIGVGPVRQGGLRADFRAERLADVDPAWLAAG